MARFYFHQQVQGGTIEDPEGTDLPDLSAARSEALEAARQLVAEAVLRGRDPPATAILVTDEGHRPLLVVPFREAIPEGLCH